MKPQRTFLILDDDEDSRYLTRRALLRAFPGARILESADTAHALEVVGGESIDGVLTDHHLGTPDGAAFMHAMRARGVTCPVVMVTASSDPTVLRRAADAGAARVFANSDLDYVGYFRAVLAGQMPPPSAPASDSD